jgi:hypothetical protein
MTRSSEGAVLRPQGAADVRDSVVLTSRFTGRVIMGWLAVAAGALPGWTHGDASQHRRGREQARLAILIHRGRLMGLAGAGSQETPVP